MSTPHIFVLNVFFAPYSYGGATIVAEQVAQSLIRTQKCRVSAISTCSRSDLLPYSVVCAEKNGVVNYLINLPPDRNTSEIYNNPKVSEIVAEILESHEPDLVHAHCIQDIGAGVLSVVHDLGIPFVLSVHDFWWICERQFMIRPDRTYCGQDPVSLDVCRNCVPNYAATKARSAYLHRQVEMASLVTYPSQFALNLSESSGLAPGKGVVWENGVEEPKAGFSDKQASRRERDNSVVFGFMGGPSQIKGWPVIRQAFTELEREDFRGVLVDGSLNGDWWPSVDISGLKGDWCVVPRFEQTDMDDFYAKIDVLLFMSQWKETFGLAIREAIARGIKVIQTDSGGTIEHPNADASALIPIGAPASTLKQQVRQAIEAGHSEPKPVTVRTFDAQAEEFLKLVQPLFSK